MPFEIADWTTVELTDVSGRKENHGDTKVQAIDVSFKWETTQDKLHMFNERLLESMYYSEAYESGQDNLEEVPEHLPNLRCPKLEMPLKWELDLTGYTMHVDYGLGEEAGSNLVLANCKVGKFKLTMKEGGTVIIAGMAQCNSDVTEQLLGKMGMLECAKVPVKLLRPLVEEPIDGSKGPLVDGAAKGEAAGQGQLLADAAPAAQSDGDATDEFIFRNTAK